jgi:hypothetical protein
MILDDRLKSQNNCIHSLYMNRMVFLLLHLDSAASNLVPCVGMWQRAGLMHLNQSIFCQSPLGRDSLSSGESLYRPAFWLLWSCIGVLLGNKVQDT